MRIFNHLSIACTFAAGVTTSLAACANETKVYPKNIGYVLFPTYQPLDVFGPLDVLTVHSWTHPLNLYLIAETLAPVSTALRAGTNKFNSNFSWTINPTHDVNTARSLNLDVLIVPGGIGTRAPNLTAIIDYVRDTYPRVQYVISVCTGAGILARAGALDGRNATTNKNAWNSTVVWGPRTNWIARARWVVDGNVWTTSGVAAGIDGVLGWIGHVWNRTTAVGVANGVEYEWHEDPSWDPFADLRGVKDVPPKQ